MASAQVQYCYPDEDVSTNLKSTTTDHYDAVDEDDQTTTEYIYDDSSGSDDHFYCDFLAKVPSGRTVTQITEVKVEIYASWDQQGDTIENDAEYQLGIIDADGGTYGTKSNLGDSWAWYSLTRTNTATSQYATDEWFKILIYLQEGQIIDWMTTYDRDAYCAAVRVTVDYDYTEAGWSGGKVNGVDHSNIGKVNSVDISNINKVNNV